MYNPMQGFTYRGIIIKIVCNARPMMQLHRCIIPAYWGQPSTHSINVVNICNISTVILI